MATQPTQPHVAAGPTPGFAQRRARALIGWLSVDEALSAINAGPPPAP